MVLCRIGVDRGRRPLPRRQAQPTRDGPALAWALGFDAGAAGGDAFEARIVSRTRMEAAMAATAPSSASGCTGLARHLLIAMRFR